MKQLEFERVNWKHRYCSGGVLRQKRRGRRERVLSSKEPIHLVMKSNYSILRQTKNYSLILKLIQKYSKKFHVKIEQLTVQNNHIHLLLRIKKRSQHHSFLRVLAGQMAQNIKSKLWKQRPFTRVIKGYRAYRRCKDYIQLNEREAQKQILYQKHRTQGMTQEELRELWG